MLVVANAEKRSNAALVRGRGASQEHRPSAAHAHAHPHIRGEGRHASNKALWNDVIH